MYKYFVVFFLLLTNNTFAMERIKVNLENNNNNLRVSLINLSENKVLLNKRFSSREVYFDFVDKNGMKFALCVMNIVSPSLDKDIIFLEPGQFIGADFPHESLIESYCLKAGQYQVKAKYKNHERIEKGVFSGSLESEWVTFEVSEAEAWEEE